MNTPSYDCLPDRTCHVFTFVSRGERIIEKIVVFSLTTPPNDYSVVLGDLYADGSIDVNSKSNNGDAYKVLSTVVKVICSFLVRYPDAKISIEGSSRARIRLYQIAIARELPALFSQFVIYGFREGNFEIFEIGKSYQSFLISLRKG